MKIFIELTVSILNGKESVVEVNLGTANGFKLFVHLVSQ